MQIKKNRLYIKKLAVDVFYNRAIDFNENKLAVVILNGFPDFAGPNALTNLLVSEDIVVFQPHLKGTYDSAGEFCPEGVKSSLCLLNTIIWEARACTYPDNTPEIFPWKINSLALVGHSFGGLLAIRYSYCLKNVEKLLLTSPALHYGVKYGCYEIGPEHYESVRKLYPFTYRLAPIEMWDGILDGIDTLPEEPYGTVKGVLILYGNNDKYFDIDKVKTIAPGLVSAYVESATPILKIVEGSGHPIAEILHSTGIPEMIVNFLKG